MLPTASRVPKGDIMAREGYSEPIVISHDYFDNVPDVELGKLLKDYLQATIYDMAFEGFTYADRTGIKRFLHDMRLNHEHKLL